MTYGTTEEFLRHFGLNELLDLPGLLELKGAGLLDANLPPDFDMPQPRGGDELADDEDPLEDAADEQSALEMNLPEEDGEGDGRRLIALPRQHLPSSFRRSFFPRHPGESRGPALDLSACSWIPAFAGMTMKASRHRKLALGRQLVYLPVAMSRDGKIEEKRKAEPAWGPHGTAAATFAAGLSFRNVSLSYGAIEAVRDVTFELRPGEIACLLGPSGCGKTTLLRIAAGVERPSQR